MENFKVGSVIELIGTISHEGRYTVASITYTVLEFEDSGSLIVEITDEAWVKPQRFKIWNEETKELEAIESGRLEKCRGSDSNLLGGGSDKDMYILSNIADSNEKIFVFIKDT